MQGLLCVGSDLLGHTFLHGNMMIANDLAGGDREAKEGKSKGRGAPSHVEKRREEEIERTGRGERRERRERDSVREFKFVFGAWESPLNP